MIAAASSLVDAQTPGQIDPSFVSGLGGGNGTNGDTTFSLFRYDFVDIIGTPQDFLVVAGAPTSVSEAAGNLPLFGRLVLPTGVHNNIDTDPTFGDINRVVYTIAQDKYVNPDKFFVGGAFGASTTQTVPAANVFRINSDFTIDDAPDAKDGRPVFYPGTGANGYVTSLLPTYDGKLVVGGLFTQFNGQSHPYIVRLTDNANALGVTDGTIDPTFDPGLAFDDHVLTLAEQLDPTTGQPNGQVLAGGLFNSVDGKPASKLARINNDGSVDTTFNPTIDERVDIVTVQPDGKILIGGLFQTVDGVAEAHIARLNFDGSLDTTFSAGVAQVPANNVNPPAVYAIVVLTDGRMYVGGNFITVNGQPRQYLALLQADGSLDPTFTPDSSIVNAVQTIVPDTFSTGDIFVGETVNQRSNGMYPPSLIALYPPPVNTPAFTNAPALSRVPEFFFGEMPLQGGFYYLAFANGNVFGYYDLDFHPVIYHDDLGFLYVFNANDGQDGVYFYDFASGHYFYTSPTYSFPYLYDFTLHSVIYYYPNPNVAGHYTTNPRYFYDFATGTVVSF